jgi:hypothetical protein
LTLLVSAADSHFLERPPEDYFHSIPRKCQATKNCHGTFCFSNETFGILGLDGPDYSLHKLTISNPDAGDLVFAIWRHGFTRRMGWLDK